MTQTGRILESCLSEAQGIENLAETCFVFLGELEKQHLIDLTRSEYTALQSVFSLSKVSLWVSSGGGQVSKNPTVVIATGLFRVLRNVRPDCPFATLGLDLRGDVTDRQLNMVYEVFQRIITHKETSQSQFIRAHWHHNLL
jgi:hypothetical protein